MSLSKVKCRQANTVTVRAHGGMQVALTEGTIEANTTLDKSTLAARRGRKARSLAT